jgi:hypothetical protein
VSRARKPFCHDCGRADCHVTGNDQVGFLWLCGDCEMIRQNPDAPKAAVPPGLPATWRVRKRNQKETLFDQGERGD